MFILVGRWGERGKRENVCWMQQRKVNNSLYAEEGCWVWGWIGVGGSMTIRVKTRKSV